MDIDATSMCRSHSYTSQMDHLLPTSAEHPHEVHGALCLAEMQIVRFALAYAMLSADASKGSRRGRVVCVTRFGGHGWQNETAK